MTFTFFVYVWTLCAALVISIAVYRKIVASKEDEFVDVLASEGVHAQQQSQVHKRVDSIDRLGKLLTVLTLLYGLGLAVTYLHHVWVQAVQLPAQ